MKNSVVMGIEPMTFGLLDQRRSRSDKQAPRSWGTQSSYLGEIEVWIS